MNLREFFGNFLKKFTPFKQWHKKIHGILEIFAKFKKNSQKNSRILLIFNQILALWQKATLNSFIIVMLPHLHDFNPFIVKAVD